MGPEDRIVFRTNSEQTKVEWIMVVVDLSKTISRNIRMVDPITDVYRLDKFFVWLGLFVLRGCIDFLPTTKDLYLY